MVTFYYDDGREEPVAIEPVDNEFEYVSKGDYWEVKVGERGGNDVIKWIPNTRVYEIEGLRENIRGHLP